MQLKKHLNPATVLSCIALFVALSGAAYAAGVGKKSVKTQHLGNGAVTALKLRNGAVTTPKLRNLAVTNPKLGDAAVSSTKIANGAVRSAALGGQVVTSGKLKNGGVTGEKLANNAVGTEKLSANAVATGKLQDGSVTAAKLSSSFLAQLVRNVSYVEKASASGGASQTATAECPAGKQVIGGGYAETGTAEAVMLTESAFVANVDGKQTGWRVSAIKDGGDGGVLEIKAFAICAEL